MTGLARNHPPGTVPGIRPRPTPRELRALMAVADGCSLAAAAHRLDKPVPWLAHVLSRAYTRLGVKDFPCHRLSHDRRRLAIRICKTNGWWPAPQDNPFRTAYRDEEMR